MLIDRSLKLIEFVALFRRQARVSALPDQFAASLVYLVPGLLLRDLAEGAAKQVTDDLLGGELSCRCFPL